MSIVEAQNALQFFHNIKKRSQGKGKQEWKLRCKKISLRPRKLKTPIKTQFTLKVVSF
jgi:hypothetical protein